MGGHHLRRTGRTGLGGRGVQARGCSKPPARPVGSHHPSRTGRTGLGGTGSPAQGVVGASFKANGGPSASENGRTGPGRTGSPAQGVFGASCQANGGPSASENRAHRPWGGRGVLPRGCSEPPARPRGGHLLQRTGRTGLGGTGSPAQGVFRASCKAYGGPFLLENRAHRPGGDGESCPGGVWSLLPCLGGAISFREPGARARGAQGVPSRGCSEPPARPMGGPPSPEYRANQPRGDGKSCPGGVRSLRQDPWRATFLQGPLPLVLLR